MKIVKAGVVIFSITLFSCQSKFIENESGKQLYEDIEEIRTHIATNKLTDIVESSSGIFYKKILVDTSARKWDERLTAQFIYRISTLQGNELLKTTKDDSVFFSARTQTFDGFAVAAGSLREGEKGIFYIPSPYMYGGEPPKEISLKPWEPIVLELELIKFYSEQEMIDVYIKRKNLKQAEITTSGVRIIHQNPRAQTDSIKKGDVIVVAYNGYFLDSEKTEFDKGTLNSYTVGSGTLVKGFEEAMTYLHDGEKATILIPSELAYGASGSGKVPPNTSIAFDVEVKKK